MGIRLQEIRVLPEWQLKANLHKAAQIYSQYVGCDILIVYSRSKDLPYEYYEFQAGEEHFQHLAGVKSPTGAVDFYNKCLDNKISMLDIIPVENMKTTSSKIEVLPKAIDLYTAKIYKIGEKDLVTLKNRFTMGIGNSETVLGIDKRDQKLPIPVTVMNRKITDFVSKPYSIFLIMKKDIGEDLYSDLVYEKTSDIFSKIDFDEAIRSKIGESFFAKKDDE